MFYLCRTVRRLPSALHVSEGAAALRSRARARRTVRSPLRYKAPSPATALLLKIWMRSRGPSLAAALPNSPSGVVDQLGKSFDPPDMPGGELARDSRRVERGVV